MKVFSSLLDPEVARLLAGGSIGALRTDTVYGLVARAVDEAAVERIYRIKGRTPSKQPIVLISDQTQLFTPASELAREFLSSVWPGRVSAILPTSDAPEWLLRGGDSLAYRLPDSLALQQLLDQTGPLIAPSANLEGSTPAESIEQAIEYFGDAVDFYVDSGTVTDNTPSQLYRLIDGAEPQRLR